jgi:hypothetical protein
LRSCYLEDSEEDGVRVMGTGSLHWALLGGKCSVADFEVAADHGMT